MTEKNEVKGFLCDQNNLPINYPTHRHDAKFWEALGRTVATFGFLEEVLARAIFAHTATRRISESEIEAEMKRWLSTLERAISDPLGRLIDSYRKAVQENNSANTANLDELVASLRKAAEIRNVICHGSWRPPDSQGRSIPFFISSDQRIFETPIDAVYLETLQRHVTKLVCHVIDSVTVIGWQFPGSTGPGNRIYDP